MMLCYHRVSPLKCLSQFLSLFCWVSIKIQNNLFCLIFPHHSPSSKEVRVGTQGRNKRQESESPVIWFLISFKKIIYLIFAFGCVCRVTRDRGSPDTRIGKQTWVLWKSSMQSQPRSHLSSPNLSFLRNCSLSKPFQFPAHQFCV